MLEYIKYKIIFTYTGNVNNIEEHYICELIIEVEQKKNMTCTKLNKKVCFHAQKGYC